MTSGDNMTDEMKEYSQEQIETLELLTEGAGKSIHKNIGIGFSYDGQTYNNGRNITFNLYHPCIEEEDDV